MSFPTGKRKFVFIAYPVSIYRLLFLRSAQSRDYFLKAQVGDFLRKSNRNSCINENPPSVAGCSLKVLLRMSRSYKEGNLSNHEEDKNDNGKKKKTLCVHHTFLHTSLPFYDYAQRETA